MVDSGAEHKTFLQLAEQVTVKVKRYNSLTRKIARAIGLEPDATDQVWINAPEYRKALITVRKRPWNEAKQDYDDWYDIVRDKPNLKPNAGLTFFLTQCYAGNSGGSIGTNGTNFMAVTATAITPAATDTTLSGELATNGFSRAQATVVISQPTATISLTYTATGTQNNVQGGALFTASSSGTMGHEYTFTSTNFVTNDQLQITVTVTIS